MKAKQRWVEMVESFSRIYDISEAEAISTIILEHVAHISRSSLIRNPDQAIDEKTLFDLMQAEHRIMQHEPVQYVTGATYFFGHTLKVSKSVLIPRPETEELVSWIIEESKNQQNIKILDIGTGSGCIAISLQHALFQSKVTGIDLSAAALEIAKFNAEIIQRDMDFILMDFLQEENWSRLENFDLLVSNPPYIPESLAGEMEKHVKEHEPALALFVPNEDPLLFYRKIALFGKTHLYKNGLIFVELHAAHAHETECLFQRLGYTTQLKEDMFGKPRMLKASLIR